MKLLIAGSRTIADDKKIRANIEHGLEVLGVVEERITEVLSGHARGVDRAGERWARKKGIKTITIYEPDWKKHGKAGGPIRNQAMVDDATIAIFIWDGKSSGTADCIQRAKRAAKAEDLQGWCIFEVTKNGDKETASKTRSEWEEASRPGN